MKESPKFVHSSKTKEVLSALPGTRESVGAHDGTKNNVRTSNSANKGAGNHNHSASKAGTTNNDTGSKVRRRKTTKASDRILSMPKLAEDRKAIVKQVISFNAQTEGECVTKDGAKEDVCVNGAEASNNNRNSNVKEGGTLVKVDVEANLSEKENEEEKASDKDKCTDKKELNVPGLAKGEPNSKVFHIAKSIVWAANPNICDNISQGSQAQQNTDEAFTLPDGWIRASKVRKSGRSAGQVDAYFEHPSVGKRFRSLKEVARFLTA